MGVLFIRVPYYIGDPKRDPNLENYPHAKRGAGGGGGLWVLRFRGPGSIPIGSMADTHRLHCGSFLGLPYRLLNMSHKKELPWSLWVVLQAACLRAYGSRF